MKTPPPTAEHTLNVWPEHSTGKWIVSYTQVGTNNEKVVGEFWHQEDAEKFAAMENSMVPNHTPALLAALENCLAILTMSDVRHLVCSGEKGCLGEASWYNREVNAARSALSLARNSSTPAPGPAKVDPRDAEVKRLREAVARMSDIAMGDGLEMLRPFAEVDVMTRTARDANASAARGVFMTIRDIARAALSESGVGR